MDNNEKISGIRTPEEEERLKQATASMEAKLKNANANSQSTNIVKSKMPGKNTSTQDSCDTIKISGFKVFGLTILSVISFFVIYVILYQVFIKWILFGIITHVNFLSSLFSYSIPKALLSLSYSGGIGQVTATIMIAVFTYVFKNSEIETGKAFQISSVLLGITWIAEVIAEIITKSLSFDITLPVTVFYLFTFGLSVLGDKKIEKTNKRWLVFVFIAIIFILVLIFSVKK